MRLLIKVLVLLGCFMVGTVWAGNSPDFQKALSNFNSLNAHAKRAALRSEWLAVEKAFESIYKTTPTGDDAPKSLFYMGRSYEELASRSKLGADRQHATDAYEKLLAAYPKHALAEDARQHLQKLQGSAGGKDDSQKTVATASKPGADAGGEKKQAQGGATLRSVRHWSSDEYTRVVIDVSKDVTFTKSLLDGKKQLQIDLAGTEVAKDVMPSRSVKDGILTQIRVMSAENRTARVILDVNQMDHFRSFTLPDPYRLVIDVFTADEKGKKDGGNKEKAEKKTAEPVEDKAAKEGGKKAEKETPAQLEKSVKAEGAQAKQSKSEPAPTAEAVKSETPDLTITGKQKKLAGSLVEQLGLTVRRIMIDAGHGGHDPGAMANGIKEKDINLKMARILGKALEAEGFEVAYTRTTDKFIPLEERTAIANARDADLFLSLHCNSYKDESIKGLEVYYLNLATDAQAVRVAARENGVSVKKISDMQFILSDLMLNSKISESRDMAGLVEQQAGQVARTFGGKGHGAKGAFFYVLTGARMPSILVEMGYITSPTDAENLKSNEYLAVLAKGIAEGVVAYKKKLERFSANSAPRS